MKRIIMALALVVFFLGCNNAVKNHLMCLLLKILIDPVKSNL